jgi:hypothetical protein
MSRIENLHFGGAAGKSAPNTNFTLKEPPSYGVLSK